MFLVSRSPAFMGNVIRYSDQLYGTWGKLEDALRSGKPALPAETYLGDDPARTRSFVQAMHERALGIARALVAILDLQGRRAMLDVGGGPGTYSVLLTERFPGLRSEVLELPGVAAVARELVAAAGASDRVSLRDGDYHSADFGSGKDVVLMSGMFHRETEQACRGLIERAAACLVPGGLLVVSDVFTDEGGTPPDLRRDVRPQHDADRPGRRRALRFGREALDGATADSATCAWCRCHRRCRTAWCWG